jgi:hypothetical protein
MRPMLNAPLRFGQEKSVENVAAVKKQWIACEYRVKTT